MSGRLIWWMTFVMFETSPTATSTYRSMFITKESNNACRQFMAQTADIGRFVLIRVLVRHLKHVRRCIQPLGRLWRNVNLNLRGYSSRLCSVIVFNGSNFFDPFNFSSNFYIINGRSLYYSNSQFKYI